MSNPYIVLGVPEDADDGAIKKAYLRRVREYPPERAPEKFQEIRAAFERIETGRLRARDALLGHDLPTPEEIALALLRQTKASPLRPTEAQFLTALRALVTAPPG